MLRRFFVLSGILLLGACAAPYDPSPAKLYTVFFEPDSDVVNALGRGVVAQAASDMTGKQGTRLSVVGYADRNGTAEANLELSKRRAAAVAKLLVDAGAPEAKVFSAGRGEELLVSEPNYGRRVVIELYHP